MNRTCDTCWYGCIPKHKEPCNECVTKKKRPRWRAEDDDPTAEFKRKLSEVYKQYYEAGHKQVFNDMLKEQQNDK